ncbi:ABC transporter permease [Actinoalloteichus hymeniacidonis]|uniref:Autoinducer 2 import system permease protein LsrD n=1 Tax=Actinoalloteichus hymeniacidonis TaxID=340345 RepID=A0AAC9HRG6_9PSEU|nr:ABC transporter permease [Actinoalloteichus hymeniacidonis]AOS64287.1 permease component of ribose/xylose/arabinose/galactoside ABC-type transporters [Actinoalloteichus hymeniacidonis]MBB5907645.1 ribose transport system permease protein [Actinoalloteichus hymeniacidonis]
MTQTAVPETRRTRLRLPATLSASTPVFVLLGVLLLVLAFVDIGFYEPDRLLAFIRRAAPLIILAAGQYFVMVSGGFDLSVGSVVTVGVVVAAELFNIAPDMPWPVAVLILLVAGMGVGLINGLISTLLAVPSFITTLGMMLILQGAVFFWTQGAPRGYLSDDYRTLGRGMVPGLPWLPWAVIVLAVVAAAAVVFMRSDTGRTLVATGDNDAAAALSGVRVHRLRVLAFVLSGLAAALAAVLVGGFTGISAQAGDGMEFEAITAVVLGGVALGGGRGSVVAAMAGALSLQTLFTLLTMLGVSGALESTVQGVIVIAAVALGAVSWSRRQRVPNSTKERR